MARAQRVLGARPNFAVAVGDTCCCIHRLHTGVGQERHFVCRFDDLRRCSKGSAHVSGLNIGTAGSFRAGLGQIRAELLPNRFAAYRVVFGCSPLNVYGLNRSLSGPVTSGHYRDGVTQIDHMGHTRLRLGVRRIEGLHLGTKHRCLPNSRVVHAGHLSIQSKHCFAGNLGRNVVSRQVCAHQRELLGILQSRLI